MPRRNVPFVPNCYYHIFNRGNNRQTVFFDADNYLYFLRGVKKYLLPVVDMIAYCLMPTHYHLMVRVKDLGGQTSEVFETSEVSSAMQKLSISYTKAINKRFERVGSLFQGHFKPSQSRIPSTCCTYADIFMPTLSKMNWSLSQRTGRIPITSNGLVSAMENWLIVILSKVNSLIPKSIVFSFLIIFARENCRKT